MVRNPRKKFGFHKMDSRSTLLAEFLASHPAAFLHFEPFSWFGIRRLRKAEQGPMLQFFKIIFAEKWCFLLKILLVYAITQPLSHSGSPCLFSQKSLPMLVLLVNCSI
jgi:hypothetical protein